VGWAEIIKARDEGIQQRRQSLAPEFSTGFEVYQPDEQERMQARSLLKSAAPDDMGRMDLSKTGKLLDAINRGTIAGTLGAPADIGNEIMRPFGYGQEKPFLGSEWFGDKMQSAGMVSANRNPLTEGIAGFIDPLSALAGAAKVPLMFAHTVYHGSPHTFDAFDASKIGTGEGAQAYGHGTYYAESPDVAKSYQQKLAKNGRVIGIEDVDNAFGAAYPSGEAIIDGIHYPNAQSLLDVYSKGYIKRDSLNKDLADLIDKHKGEGAFYKADIPDEWLPKMLDWDKPLSEQGEEVRRILRGEGYSGNKINLGVFGDGPDGVMNDSFVFDNVKEARAYANELRKKGYKVEPHIRRDEGPITGADLALDYSGNDYERSERLKELGIPGLKYLDGSSRDIMDLKITPPSETVAGDWMVKGRDYNSKGKHFATEAEARAHLKQAQDNATRNYVIFPGNEGKVKILERNGRELLAQRLEEIPAVPDYRGEHTAAMKGDGAPLYDLTEGGNKIYPDDVYSANGPRYYGDGNEAMDRQSFAIVNSVKGKPNATVTMYRAVPKESTPHEELAALEKQMNQYMRRGKTPNDSELKGSRWYDDAWERRAMLEQAVESYQPTEGINTINNGDWVTINRQYAKDHGESALNGKYKILSKKVKARKLYTQGDSIHEWGYDESGKIDPRLLLGGTALGIGGAAGYKAYQEK
jgi:hypothetical protein